MISNVEGASSLGKKHRSSLNDLKAENAESRDKRRLTKKSSSLRLQEVSKKQQSSRRGSSSKTIATKRLSQSSPQGDLLEWSFASLRTEEEGANLKSCMRVKTLDESLSSSLEVPVKSSDSLQPSESKPSPQFSSLEIREYPILLGDNPSVTTGVPLTIGWEPQDTTTTSVDEYEEHRGPRREKIQLAIPPDMREERLLDAGFSYSALLETRKEIQKLQRERRLQIHRHDEFPFHDRMVEGKESLNRKLKKWILGQRSNRVLYDEFRNQQVAYCLVKEELKRSSSNAEVTSTTVSLTQQDHQSLSLPSNEAFLNGSAQHRHNPLPFGRT